MGVSQNRGFYPQNGWFISWKTPIKMDDLGVKILKKKWLNTHMSIIPRVTGRWWKSRLKNYPGSPSRRAAKVLHKLLELCRQASLA